LPSSVHNEQTLAVQALSLRASLGTKTVQTVAL
jgi:hypothetical protein